MLSWFKKKVNYGTKGITFSKDGGAVYVFPDDHMKVYKYQLRTPFIWATATFFRERLRWVIRF